MITTFIQFQESRDFANEETTKQADKAMSELESFFHSKKYKKTSDKSRSLTKYSFTSEVLKDKAGRELNTPRTITIDEWFGNGNKAILNLSDTDFKKSDFSEFVWDLTPDTHQDNIKKIIKYIKASI